MGFDSHSRSPRLSRGTGGKSSPGNGQPGGEGLLHGHCHLPVFCDTGPGAGLGVSLSMRGAPCEVCVGWGPGTVGREVGMLPTRKLQRPCKGDPASGKATCHLNLQGSVLKFQTNPVIYRNKNTSQPSWACPWNPGMG